MGLIDRIFGMIFGGQRNVVRETIEVFRENAETGAANQFVFSAGNSHSLCISASGFAYIGNCQP
mgnify:CR=1 FL=1